MTAVLHWFCPAVCVYVCVFSICTLCLFYHQVHLHPCKIDDIYLYAQAARLAL